MCHRPRADRRRVEAARVWMNWARRHTAAVRTWHAACGRWHGGYAAKLLAAAPCTWRCGSSMAPPLPAPHSSQPCNGTGTCWLRTGMSYRGGSNTCRPLSCHSPAGVPHRQHVVGVARVLEGRQDLAGAPKGLHGMQGAAPGGVPGHTVIGCSRDAQTCVGYVSLAGGVGAFNILAPPLRPTWCVSARLPRVGACGAAPAWACHSRPVLTLPPSAQYAPPHTHTQKRTLHCTCGAACTVMATCAATDKRDM